MKFVNIVTPGDVQLQECEMPVPGPGEALLKLLYGGICGSDLGTFKGTFLYASYPRIPGHEFSAQIVEIGENDRGFKKGDIVTCNPYFNCKECYSCKRGFVNCCHHLETMGAQRNGAFRQYIVMPVERIISGKGLDPKTLATIEPFCISYHGAKRGQVKPGDKVLVVGTGTIGCLAVKAATLLGGEVYAVDVEDFKLEKAKEFGAVGTCNSRTTDFMEWVKATTDGNGFDVCLEAVGLPSTFQNAVDAACFEGRVVVIGIGKQSLDFKYAVLQTKELNLFGSRNALTQDFLELIDAVSSGRVDISKLVTDEYELDDVVTAFREFANNGAHKLKTIVHFADPE